MTTTQKRGKAPARLEDKLTAVDREVRAFMAAAMQAREVRVTRIAPAADGAAGWEVEADILVPDLAIKRLGLRLRQEVLEARRCSVHLDPALAVQSYEFIDEAEG